MLYEIVILCVCAILVTIVFFLAKLSKNRLSYENLALKEKTSSLENMLQILKTKELELEKEKVQLLTQFNNLKKELENKEQAHQSLNKELKEIENAFKVQHQAQMQSLLEKEFLDQKLADKEQVLQDLLNQKEALKKEYEERLKNLEQKFDTNLKQQSQNLLHQNKLMLNEDMKKLLEEIFIPVKKSVKEYSERLSENEISLKANIKNMFEFSQNIGKDAQNLAKILKGEKKIRGNFAELQLKSVLESSGLIEGEQYKLQEHFKEDNKSYKPDAVVFLDQQKSIIIDAKFSLPSEFDFENFSPLMCQSLAKNLRARIDELAKKPYTNFDTNTYDFILLFIPYQNILDLALSEDSELYRYAYDKKIYLTTPNTLFMALNTIYISWQNVRSNENITKAFQELGKFHDKFAGLIEDFEKIKTASKRLDDSIENMQNKLYGGSGNLSSRIEKLKILGAKTQKSLEKTE